MISNLRFEQWHAVVPEPRWEDTRRLLEEGSQFRFRLTLMAGAYLLFTLVITALAATSAGLAFGLSGPELGLKPLSLALTGGAVTAALVLYEMLTRDGRGEDRRDRSVRCGADRNPDLRCGALTSARAAKLKRSSFGTRRT